MRGLETPPRILIVDSHGQPVRWAALTRAARYYASGKVVHDLGDSRFAMTGGLQEVSGERSCVVSSSIVMIRGRHRNPSRGHVGLSKYRLFARDRQVCAYCGMHGSESDLTVEHIVPVSRGGRHEWTNVVTACRSCNTRKGNRRPEEANMPLLFFSPSPAVIVLLPASKASRQNYDDKLGFIPAESSRRKGRTHAGFFTSTAFFEKPLRGASYSLGCTATARIPKVAVCLCGRIACTSVREHRDVRPAADRHVAFSGAEGQNRERCPRERRLK